MAKTNPVTTGELKQRIVVYDVSQGEDGQGGFHEALSERFETWAKVDPLTGGRALQYGQIVNSKSYRIICRKKDITSSNLIGYGSLIMTIQSIVDFESEGWFNEIITSVR